MSRFDSGCSALESPQQGLSFFTLFFEMMVQDVDEFAVCRFPYQGIPGDLNKQFPVSVIPAAVYCCADAVFYVLPAGLEVLSDIDV